MDVVLEGKLLWNLYNLFINNFLRFTAKLIKLLSLSNVTQLANNSDRTWHIQTFIKTNKHQNDSHPQLSIFLLVSCDSMHVTCHVESHKEIGQEQISTARKEEVLLQGSMTVAATEPVEQHKGAQPQNQPKIIPNLFKLLAPILIIILLHRTVLEIVQFHQTDETEQEIVTEAPQMHTGRVDSSHFQVGIEGQ